MFKVNTKSTERRQWQRSFVFIGNSFQHILTFVVFYIIDIEQLNDWLMKNS